MDSEEKGFASLTMLENFKRELEDIKTKFTDPILEAEAVISYCERHLTTLKENTINLGFVSKENEITFFKHIKPQILGTKIYYIEKYKLLLKRPVGLPVEWETFLLQHSSVLNWFMQANSQYYQYYRAGATDRDAEYFLRANTHTDPFTDAYIDIDKSFSTGYDLIFAKIISNEMLAALLNEWRAAPVTQNIRAQKSKKLRWTDSKTALIEFVYALHALGCFNEGKASLELIFSVFEDEFDINLGNTSRMFQDIIFRKKGTNVHLTRLQKAFDDKVAKMLNKE